MKSVDTNMTVGQLVAERPSRSRVFEQLGIDYCCGGKQTLAEACGKKGLDAEVVRRVMQAAEAAEPADERDWREASLTELCRHIVATHHEYVARELPRLTGMLAKVVAVHGAEHPELDEVRFTFACLRGELEEHMIKEERVLFPAIEQIESGTGDGPLHCGIERPVAVMLHEHDNAGNALAKLRELTKDYAPPQGACGTYRALLSGLADFERDLHQHIHKENNILFPRAMELAQRACVG